MRLFEGISLWIGIFFYVVSFSLFLGGVVFKKDRQVFFAWKGFIAAFAFHTATIVVRWIESGHPPVLWTYEHALISSWFLAFIFILASRWLPAANSLCVAVSPIILMIIGYGIMSKETGLEPLPPPYQSNWLWVHVTFAWLAYSAFAFSSVVAAIHLFKARTLMLGRHGFFARFRSAEELEDLTFRIILVGFVGLTVEMGAGAIWAYGLWGRYWAWDPMETWTLISWLIYALYLHLRVTMGWRGTKMAWIAIIAFASIFIAFGGIAMMMGLHGTLV